MTATDTALAQSGFEVASGMATRAPAMLSRTIRTSSMWRTAAGRAYDEALDRHTPLLRAYLAVRLRSHERGRDAYEALRDDLAGGVGESLFGGPGPKALLLHQARHIARELAAGGVPLPPVDQAPWDSAPLGSPRGYGDLLDRIRASLAEPELETLELAFAHELSDRELAFVLEEPEGEVKKRIEASFAWLGVQMGTEALARGRELGDLVSDALRVLPPPLGDVAETNGPPPSLAKGTLIGERYRVESCLGGGAFGYVYRARDVRVPTHVVALKLLHRAAKTGSAKEGAMAEVARITSAFHPSLVQLKEHGWHDERLWFVMPWYQGETLAERAEREPLNLAEAAGILLPIARATSALHAAGIRHQDIKPENILLARLTTNDEVLPVLLDLGVASHSEDDLAIGGTPMYFAPEMATRVIDEKATLPIGDKADVFALGLTLLHSVIPPPKDEPDFDVFMLERSNGVTVPEDRSLKRVRQVLETWLSTDPAERPTASVVASELEALSQGHKPKRPKKPPVLRLLAAALLGAAAAFGFAQMTDAGSGNVRPEVVESARTHGLRERLRVAEDRARALEAITRKPPVAPESDRAELDTTQSAPNAGGSRGF